jgi:S-adenosylmethionine:tRNA ribosyltransferase-isomerase
VKEKGKRVFAVGTTTTKTVEALMSGKYTEAARQKTEVEDRRPGGRRLESEKRDQYLKQSSIIRGATDLFITPGYRFMGIDGLITNFHLPKSTPLMLVSALAGRENVLKAYKEAIDRNYRFFSYGDAMLIL